MVERKDAIGYPPTSIDETHLDKASLDHTHLGLDLYWANLSLQQHSQPYSTCLLQAIQPRHDNLSPT
jgi:hypothetical protein